MSPTMISTEIVGSYRSGSTSLAASTGIPVQNTASDRNETSGKV
jgi:hypothetical protein